MNIYNDVKKARKMSELQKLKVKKNSKETDQKTRG